MQHQPPNIQHMYQLKDDATKQFDRLDQKTDKIIDKLDTQITDVNKMLTGLNMMISKHDLSIEHINKRFEERDTFYQTFLINDKEDRKLMDKQIESKIDALDKRISDNEKFKIKLIALCSVVPVLITIAPFIAKLFAA